MKKEHFLNNLGMKNKLFVKFKDINKNMFNTLGMKNELFNSLRTKNELFKV